jgi:hypothetical protein
MWVGTEEICTALRISPWQMRNWRKRYGCPIVTLPSGNVALSKELFRRWLLVMGQHQIEATNRYREEKLDYEGAESTEVDTYTERSLQQQHETKTHALGR